MALTKSDARAVEMARQHLRGGNSGAYARLMSATVRAARTTRAAAAVMLCADADGYAVTVGQQAGIATVSA